MQQKFVGIDIGKQTIVVCNAQDTVSPHQWPTITLNLTDPAWHKDLGLLVGYDTTVALEPTGWYYSRPIVVFLETVPVRTVLRIAHHATKSTRNDRISSQKTDANDARALALKARDWASGERTLGVKHHNPDLEDLNIELRLTMNAWKRAVKQHSSANNRLDTFAQGMWPALANSKATWLRATANNFITPQDIRNLSIMLYDGHWPPGYEHGNARNALHKLATNLPCGLPVPAPLRLAVQEALEDLHHSYQMLEKLEKDLKGICLLPDLFPVTANWLTVPGTSLKAIAALHAATNCQAQNFTENAFRAAVGCHPSRQESGAITESKDNKRGYREAKKQLHLWMLRLLKKEHRPNPVATYFDTLKARGNKNAIHAARGKLTKILSAIARNGTPYEERQ